MMLHSIQGRNRILYRKLAMLHQFIIGNKVTKYFLLPKIQLFMNSDEYLGNNKTKYSEQCVNFIGSLWGGGFCLTFG